MDGSDMEKELNGEQLRNLMMKLCEEKALEIISEGSGKLYIPYMMNDAVEAYCILSDVSIPGSLPDNLENITFVEAVSAGGRCGLLLRAKEQNVASIWYGKCLYIQRLYQYHRIMHCWVKGEEHMRMLVYMIGTICDKYIYLGKDACNEEEQALMPLMEYRPFRFFSPMHESLDRWYPDTKRGFETMKTFLREAEQEKLLRLVKIGGVSGKLFSVRIREQIAGSEKLFDYLYRKICSASCRYEERHYPEGPASRMELQKRSVHEKILNAGFTGKYPDYRKGRKRLRVFEEHPFTVAGMDDMDFSIHLLEIDPEAADGVFRVISP